MSISDEIVVMKDGVVQQIGEPQKVYDNPSNLFVSKFLGTPPITVFNGKVSDGGIYIGSDRILDCPFEKDGDVFVAIRPEGFVPHESGKLNCTLSGVEVMGRDISILATNENATAPVIRTIVDADTNLNFKEKDIKFNVKPEKCFVFDKETEIRIR